MRIQHNGKAEIVHAEYLQAALDELGYDEASVATALNGEFVARESRADCQLSPGDSLEVLEPVQGG